MGARWLGRGDAVEDDHVLFRPPGRERTRVLDRSDRRDVEVLVEEERGLEVQVPVGDDEHLGAPALGEKGVGVVVDGEVVPRAAGEGDRGLERSARAREVRIEAREPLAGLEVELGEVDELAVAEEGDLDVLRSVAGIGHLEHHLVAALVERVAADGKLGDADVPCCLRADRDVRELHRAEVDRPLRVGRRTERAVGDDDDLGEVHAAERVGGEAERAGEVGARVGGDGRRRSRARARRCLRSSDPAG